MSGRILEEDVYDGEAGRCRSDLITAQPRNYYGLNFAAGALSSNIRWFLTPLDNIKCNMQVNPSRFPSFYQGFLVIHRSQGLTGLYRGLFPTVLAYGTQTGVKYGVYEIIKDSLEGDHRFTHSNSKGLVYILSAAAAECVADVLMCPWEMLKVRVQTDPAFPRAFVPSLRVMLADAAFPFGSLGPLLARQLPTTIVNFYTFEKTTHAAYAHVLKRPQQSCNTPTQLGVTLVAGYVAGFTSSICSHLPDSLISLKARPEYSAASFTDIVRQVGLWRLATKGLGPRVAMTGSIIAFQWLCYNSIKGALGLRMAGGSH